VSGHPSELSGDEKKLLDLLDQISRTEDYLAQVERVYGPKHRVATSAFASLNDLLEKLDSHLNNFPELKPKAAAVLVGDQAMPDEATLQKIAASDRTLQSDLARRDQLRSTVSLMQAQGYGPEYRPLLVSQRGLEICQRRIARYANAYLRRHAPTTQP
jgi:hypothetical protein